MLDRNLKRWELALMFGLLCGLLGGFWLDREQTQLAGRVIRFHVIANSDSPEDQALKLQVRDRGIGIEKGEESQIFRRFYRGRRVTVQEGFGIGLYFAREIINLHGGFVTTKRMNPGLLIEANLPL